MKPGDNVLAAMDAAGGEDRIVFPFSSGNQAGAIVTYFPSDCLRLYLIDIHASTIPPVPSKAPPPGRILKINYCAHGRCELTTKSGEYTYLVGGEVAVDTGQARNSFFFPTSDYVGIEVIALMDDALREIPSLNEYSGVLEGARLRRVDEQPHPLIFPADEIVTQIASEILRYDAMRLGGDMIRVKMIELLIWLARQLPEKQSLQRRFCTRAQVEIARRCFDLITSDLSRRWPAKALAERFGVSETSIKNYFRNVYGYGFLEYQNKARLECAAEMLSQGAVRVGDVAKAVGYASQTRFAEAFRDYYGCLPLEYRRRKRIE